jgi:hypothetical protein
MPWLLAHHPRIPSPTHTCNRRATVWLARCSCDRTTSVVANTQSVTSRSLAQAWLLVPRQRFELHSAPPHPVVEGLSTQQAPL